MLLCDLMVDKDIKKNILEKQIYIPTIMGLNQFEI